MYCDFYQVLIKFAQKMGLTYKDNYTSKKIAAYITLDDEGKYVGIDHLGKTSVCATAPTIGSYAATATWSDILIEKKGIIFDKTHKKHKSWVQNMCKDTDILELQAVQKFITDYENDQELTDEILKEFEELKVKPDDKIGFKINGKNLEEVPNLIEYVRKVINDIQSQSKKKKKEQKEIISSLTGERGISIPADNAPAIQNISDSIVKKKYGFIKLYIACCKEPSYQLDGFGKAQRTQITVEDAENLVAALEYMLNHKEHNDPDTKMVFSYDQEPENIISEFFSVAEKDAERRANNEEISENDIIALKEDFDSHNALMRDIVNCIYDGTPFCCPDDNSKYFRAQLLINNGRFCFINERTGTYKDLAESIYRWYEDTKLTYSRRKRDEITKKSICITHDYILSKLKPILAACVISGTPKEEAKRIEKELKKEQGLLLNSIFENEQIPYSLIQKALGRLDSSSVKGNFADEFTQRDITRLQLLKCYLIREGEEIMNVVSTPTGEVTSTSIAYAIGRLIAIADKMQYIGNNYQKSNTSISSRFNELICTYPEEGVYKLMDSLLYYKDKLDGIGKYNFYDKITAIANDIPMNFYDYFEGTFNEKEKSAFYIAILHQVEALRKIEKPVAEEKEQNTIES